MDFETKDSIHVLSKTLIIDFIIDHSVLFSVPISMYRSVGYLSQSRAKLRDWAARLVRAGCYPWAALSLIDS